MATLLIKINKTLLGAEGLPVAFASLTPLSGQKGKAIRTLVPLGGGSFKSVELPAGDWLVSARLPSGEHLSERVTVKEGGQEALSMNASGSSHEWRGWPTALSRMGARTDLLESFVASVSGQSLESLTEHAGNLLLSVLPSHVAEMASKGSRQWLESLTVGERVEVQAPPPRRLQPLVWDKATHGFEKSEWPKLGVQQFSDADVVLNNGNDPVRSESRICARLVDQPSAICVPLPWGMSPLQVQVQAMLPEGGFGDRAKLRAYVIDPVVTAVVSFLDAGDLEAARAGGSGMASWAEAALADKQVNPLGAALGALTLIRLGEFEKLHHWPLNLADWFTWLPDGAAIAAWCVLMMGMRRPEESEFRSPADRAWRSVELLRTAARRGTFYFSDSVRLARECSSILQRDKTVGGDGERFPRALVDWIERAFRSVQPDSLIASYECDSEQDLAAVLSPLSEESRTAGVIMVEAFGAGPAAEPQPDTIYFNGINAATGQYAVAPLTTKELGARLQPVPSVPSIAGLESFGVPFRVDLTNLAQAGWGIVFAEDATEDLRKALALLTERRSKAAGPLFKLLDYKKGEQIRDWYQRHSIEFANFEPTRVPYYLLLVGPPTSIPFDFQWLLAVEYAVGRLSFDTIDEYRRYAASVVAYETQDKVNNAREVVYWGTRHPGDPATSLSSSMLLDPLVNGVKDGPPSQRKSLHDDLGYAGKAYVAEDGVRAALLSAVSGPKPPALLFTASHGMEVPSGLPNQLSDNGGLLCQDWTGFGSIKREHYVTGADISDDANVSGMVAFCFACYGAGTPDRDDFFRRLGDAGNLPPRAPQPFVAALPRRLLAHPRGSALAVIGHVDRAFGCSIRPAKLSSSQIGPFRNGLSFILDGAPVGWAISQQFSQRYTTLSAMLNDALSPSRPANLRPTDRDLVMYWLETNDARNYVVLGDPAVQIRKDALSA
ncbi:MAG TPA: C25 family cysteine peptidase [Tepidisphaeraceae bacterium]|jgi:hypothetical protein|nr:C25 family cysteine peptidase [Tepidisphaeraceae bacterium]